AGAHDAGPGDAGAEADAGDDDDAGPEQACGNGVLNVGEQCDDGDTAPGDGCDELCQQEEGWLCTGAPSSCEPVCGDGVVVAGEEECDEGLANSDTAPDA